MFYCIETSWNEKLIGIERGRFAEREHTQVVCSTVKLRDTLVLGEVFHIRLRDHASDRNDKRAGSRRHDQSSRVAFRLMALLLHSDTKQDEAEKERKK